ncbi:unnamed protein product [Closterium sp. NIES-65]|nr:unnamed protein product [Closterium sp. NIES-65]CAI5987342.1 unnamed protein product [Closterium sp. NIES-65]
MALVPFLSRLKAMVSPARSEPPFPVERLPDDVLALVLRALSQTSFRHALVSKRWLRLSTAALSHLTVQHRGFKTFLLEIHNPEHFRNAQLAWLPLPHLLSALRRFHALTHVSLGSFSILSADGDVLFQCLAATCPRLLYLTVEHQFKMSVTVDGLASLFRGCRKLRELFLLTTNGLPHLPASLSLLTDLQTLHVCSNIHYGEDKLQELVSPPESIGALQQLRELRISAGANFRGLDECVGLLSNLRTLSISNLWSETVLPESLGNLPRLKTLELDLPALERLPEKFCEGSLPACLEKLSLSRCEKLQELPPSLYTLTRLESLHIELCSLIESLKPLIPPHPPDGSERKSESFSPVEMVITAVLCTAAVFAAMLLISIPLLTVQEIIAPASTALGVRPPVMLVPAALLASAAASSNNVGAILGSLLLAVVVLLVSLTLHQTSPRNTRA